jgi:transposase
LLFPERLEDGISEDNAVWLIDVFGCGLKQGVLGFERSLPAVWGRAGDHPSKLLKIHICGHLNGIQSSRPLEREPQPNVELLWLTRRLAPDFKAIADFRRGKGRAIRKVCAQFVRLCLWMNLFAEAIVATDGRKFKAMINRYKNFMAPNAKSG